MFNKLIKTNNMNAKYIIFSAVLCSLGFSSCLKNDTALNLADIPATKIFELAPNDNPSLGANDRFYSVSYNVSATPQQLKVPVYLNTTSGTLPQDVTVTIAKDNAGITAYNAANGTSYEFLPDSTYNTALNVTIPAGKQFGYVTLNIKTSKVDPTASYMVAYKIVTVPAGTVISNTRAAVQYAIAVKNIYDGKYQVTGTMVDATRPSFSGPYGPNVGGVSWNVNLITAGASTVNLFDLDYSQDYFHKILNNGASSYYGSLGVVFNFNPDNTVASVVNLYGQPAANGRSLKLDPSGVNKWDPTTKTLKVKYWMDQPSVIAGHRTSFDETYTYVGPR